MTIRPSPSGVYIVKGDDVASISRCPKKEEDEDDDFEDEGAPTLDLE